MFTAQQAWLLVETAPRTVLTPRLRSYWRLGWAHVCEALPSYSGPLSMAPRQSTVSLHI